MSIDKVLKEYFVGKYLTLYRFQWVEHSNKKNGDIISVYWKCDSDVGDMNFNYWPSVHSSGLKWRKSQLDSMKIESRRFEIRDVDLNEYEEWYKSTSFAFDLSGFDGGSNRYAKTIFEAYIYDELEINDSLGQ